MTAFLLPIGGYKGAALALMFGLLAGTLNGAANGADVVDFNKDDTTPTNTGQAICVVDIKAFGEPVAFKRQVDAVIRRCCRASSASGCPAKTGIIASPSGGSRGSRCRRPCIVHSTGSPRTLR